MTGHTVRQRLALTTLLVRDYDEGIAFFVDTLGFTLVEDTPLVTAGDGCAEKRWVVVAPPGDGGGALLLAVPTDDTQVAAIGRQAGGRVFLFLQTDDFRRDHALYRSRGVRFVRGEPREEPYGTVAVFEDVSGNLWDLIEPREADPVDDEVPAPPVRLG